MTAETIEYWIRFLRLPFTGMVGAVFLANNLHSFSEKPILYGIFVIFGLFWILGGTYVDAIQAVRVVNPQAKGLITTNMGKCNVIFTFVAAIMLVVGNNLWYGIWSGVFREPYRIIFIALCFVLAVVIILMIIMRGRKGSLKGSKRDSKGA